MGCCWNGTHGELHFHCLTRDTQIFLCVFCFVLIISLLMNILCCVLRFCPGKSRCQLRKKQKHCSRQMEDNPIYGNLTYTDTSDCLYTEAAPLRPSVSSSSLRNPQRVNPGSKECYANLTLKAPRPQSGRSSPQIQSQPAPSEEPAESEREEDVNTDTVSTMSGLYASVQTQKTKTIDTTDTGEDYANHL